MIYKKPLLSLGNRGIDHGVYGSVSETEGEYGRPMLRLGLQLAYEEEERQYVYPTAPVKSNLTFLSYFYGTSIVFLSYFYPTSPSTQTRNGQNLP